jgi:glucuronoarabinoxylan endo-1,4-beta-xylanase
MAKKTENCGNIIGWQLLLLSAWGHLTVLLITSLMTTAVEGATGTVNYNTVYQQLEGFGGAAVYDCPTLISHPKSEEVYDLLFQELGIEILRIRNCYGYDSSAITATKTIITEAREALRSPDMKLELVPWSPPGYLKSGGSTSGGTLAGGPSAYVYTDYANWWWDSLVEWASGVNGVEPDFISIQNEPDYENTNYDTCKFLSTENSSYAGYDKAFQAVYNKLNAEMGSDMPEMWAPCTMGFGGSIPYITALTSIGQIGNVDGFSHHLYSDGSYDSPDGMTAGMASYYSTYGYKPLHMTEYVKLSTTPNFDMAWKFSWHIYNCLYYLHSTSFFNWTLFRGTGFDKGGIVTLTPGSNYTIRPQYWFLKAYTHFTDKDWYVVGTSTDSGSLRIAAFKNPDGDRLTVVITNISASSTSLTGLTLDGFSPVNSEVYRSSETENWVYLGAYSLPLTLPAYSVTTIAFFPAGTPRRTLTVSSSYGGDVTTPAPGEGAFPYDPCVNARIVATDEPGYNLVSWTGTAVDAGKVANPNSAKTTVMMDANYTVFANFKPCVEVQLLGSWVAGTTHAKEPGTNRALVVTAHAEYGSSSTPSLSMTYGGQTMTKIKDRTQTDIDGSDTKVYVAAFILNEAGVAAASSSTISASWGGSPTSTALSSVFLTNVKQTTLVGATAGAGGHDTSTVTTSAMATSIGDMVLDAATSSSTGTYTPNYDFTEALEATISSADGFGGYKSSSLGASEYATVTHSVASGARHVIIGFVVKVMTVTTCDDVQDAGVGLPSDLDGNCYVNLNDFGVFAQYWLHTDCAAQENCEGADFELTDGVVNFFDLGKFVEQWLWCNNPDDPGCEQNW